MSTLRHASLTSTTGLYTATDTCIGIFLEDRFLLKRALRRCSDGIFIRISTMESKTYLLWCSLYYARGLYLAENTFSLQNTSHWCGASALRVLHGEIAGYTAAPRHIVFLVHGFRERGFTLLFHFLRDFIIYVHIFVFSFWSSAIYFGEECNVRKSEKKKKIWRGILVFPESQCWWQSHIENIFYPNIKWKK